MMIEYELLVPKMHFFTGGVSQKIYKNNSKKSSLLAFKSSNFAELDSTFA